MSLLKKYNCLPYFMPEPTKTFIKEHLHLEKGQSIFCSSDQLRVILHFLTFKYFYEETFQKMADNIDKYTAINSNDGTNPIKGDIIRSC